MLMTTLLARMPDLRRRLQTQHINHRGYCRECGNEVAWPCELYQIATEAERASSAAPLLPSQRAAAHRDAIRRGTVPAAPTQRSAAQRSAAQGVPAPAGVAPASPTGVGTTQAPTRTRAVRKRTVQTRASRADQASAGLATR
jgi:hypothetical protein